MTKEVHEGLSTASFVQGSVGAVVVVVVEVVGDDVVVDAGAWGGGIAAAEGNIVILVLRLFEDVTETGQCKKKENSYDS